jgi:putative hydrolase of the HAD superfamily
LLKKNAAETGQAVETWIFDLDNTLYPAECDLFSLVSQRMTVFIANKFSLSPDDARARQKKYFQSHGTTLRGLMTEHGTEPAEFLDFVHDIDFSRVAPSPLMAAALPLLPGRKYVFTNASKDYAGKVLARLGIDAHIDGIFDIEAAGFMPKPDPAAYRKMLEDLAIDPHSALMVEDIARNLKPAADLGMRTAWVPNSSSWSKAGAEGMSFDFVVEDLPRWLHEMALKSGGS